MWSNAGYGGDEGWYKNKSAAAFSLTAESSTFATATTGPISYPGLTWTTSNTRLLVAITYIPNTTEAPSSLSLGGGTYTKIAGTTTPTPAGGTYTTEWWISSATVGTGSGTLQVTYSGTGNTGYDTAVAVYALTTTTPTPNAVQIGNTVFSTSAATSAALAVPTGGGGVVAFIISNAFSLGTQTNWTTDFTTNSSGGKTFIFGRTNYTGSSQTPSATWTGNSQAPISTVSWAP